jgi:hypothetical protein
VLFNALLLACKQRESLAAFFKRLALRVCRTHSGSFRHSGFSNLQSGFTGSAQQWLKPGYNPQLSALLGLAQKLLIDVMVF